MVAHDYDDALRAAMFAYLRARATRNGGFVTSRELDAFEFEGKRLPLRQHMRGIRLVAGLEAALSILTTFAAKPEDRPYEDDIGDDGYLRYKWQRSSAEARDNQALRAARNQGKPLAYFRGIASAVYQPILPVWLVDEEPAEEQFVVAVDEVSRQRWDPAILQHPADTALQREYALETIKRRVHQPAFRSRVLLAYGAKCALCRLRHAELLDAAHIKEDSEGGEPIVPNGVSMCAIHHRAFDSNVLGIRPDYVVQIRKDVLAEQDGPTLQHALQGLHGGDLALPRQQTARPDPLLLEERFERFRLAG